MAAAEEPPRRGGATRVTLSEGQRFRITGISLANPPAAAAGQPPVSVWAEVGHEAHTIGTLSSEEPIKPVLLPVELDDGEFVLRHDSAASSVRLYGDYLDPPEQDGGEEEPTRRRFFVDVDAEELGGKEEEAEAEAEHEYKVLTVEDLEVRYVSDCGEDESDDGDGEEEEEEEEGDETSGSSDVEVAGEISKRKISTEDSL